MTDVNLGVPEGFMLVPDERVVGFVTPDGFRLVRATKDALRGAAGGGRKRERAGVNYARRMLEFAEGLKEGDPKGTFYPYGTSTKMPAMLKERVGGLRGFAWLTTLGGMIRIADEPTEGTGHSMDRMARMEPGDWYPDPTPARLPGFCMGENSVHGFIRVRVSDATTLASTRLRGITGVPAAPSSNAAAERLELVKRVSAVFGADGPDRTSAVAWAQVAPLGHVREWLKQSGAEVAP
ncbi:MAG: hypothetical protein IT581_12230 [Verrucomicrobiales bacterium]|nr:hypothetical protein [Verrucomicrobiales bacterium]